MKQQLLINNECMIKKISFVLFVLISTNIALAQQTDANSIRGFRISELKSEKMKETCEYYQIAGFLKLPVNFDRKYRSYLIKNNLQNMRPYPYRHVNDESPFYVNVNKKNMKRNDKDSRIYLFNQTSGNYVVGVVMAIAPGYEAVKRWLVTFSFSGDVIDYIPIYETFAQSYVMESQVNQDFSVDVNHIDFPGNDYIVKDYKPLDNLKGQRIDTKHQITPEGKFAKLSEVHYQPQIYTPAMLLDKTTNIRDRNEKLLNK